MNSPRRCIYAGAWSISGGGCAKGVKRPLPMLVRVCADPLSTECPHASYPTQEVANAEAVARKDRVGRVMHLLTKGLSACCEAPLDTSKVIKSGEHKGHGPRMCSKCGEVALYI